MNCNCKYKEPPNNTKHELSIHQFDEIFDEVDMEEEVFSPPPVAARFRKDSFRIVQVLDSPSYRIADDTIEEADELAQPPLKSRQTRLGSLDANAGHPSMMMMHNIKQHPTIMRSSSVHSKKSRENSGTAWKQLNDELNHIFPCKKSSNPSMGGVAPEMMQQLTGTGSRTVGGSGPSLPGGPTGPQNNNRPTSPCVVRELRKSASRSSLISDYEYMSEDEQIYLHTIHGGGRINTLTSSRHLEPFSKITRRRSGEDSNNISEINIAELNGVRKHGKLKIQILLGITEKTMIMKTKYYQPKCDHICHAHKKMTNFLLFLFYHNYFFLLMISRKKNNNLH